jgi:hypothetical protein
LNTNLPPKIDATTKATKIPPRAIGGKGKSKAGSVAVRLRSGVGEGTAVGSGDGLGVAVIAGTVGVFARVSGACAASVGILREIKKRSGSSGSSSTG